MHVGNAAMRGEIFVIRKHGAVSAVAFVQRTTKGALIGNVIATRDECREIFRRASKQWPGVERFFTYRWRHDKPTFTELRAVRRFCT